MDISNLLNRPSVKELGERINSPVYLDWIRFMCVLAKNKSFDSDREYSPSYALDQVWHQALLSPVLYVKVCHEVCLSVGVDLRVIDHNPTRINGSLDAYYDRLINTRWDYQKLFFDEPSQYFYDDDGGDDSYSESTEDDPIYTVTSLTNKKVDVQVPKNATAYDLWCKLSEQENIPSNLLQLVVKGKSIASHTTIEEAKSYVLDDHIQYDTRITYLFMMRGC